MPGAADKLSPFIATSAVLHVLLVVLVVVGPALFPANSDPLWGTSTDPNIRAGLASSLPGIPLPSPPVVQETAKGFHSKSLNPEEAAPPGKSTPVEADVKVPSGITKPEKKKDPAPPRTAQNEPSPNSPPLPSNAVPGRGGQMALPYGQVGGGAAQATFGDQTFGTLFPDYVTNMTRAVKSAWQDSIAIPRGSSPRVYVTFTIGRQGQVSNLDIAQSSGSAQLDNSAKRAVLAAKLPPLPVAYSGSSVDVRFYFEYTR